MGYDDETHFLLRCNIKQLNNYIKYMEYVCNWIKKNRPKLHYELVESEMYLTALIRCRNYALSDSRG